MRSSEVDASGYRIVSGRGEAAPLSGSGFSISRTSTGTYSVRFDKPFRSPPTVEVNPEHNNAYYAIPNAVTASGFTVYVRDSGGTFANATIHFTARGLA